MPPIFRRPTFPNHKVCGNAFYYIGLGRVLPAPDDLSDGRRFVEKNLRRAVRASFPKAGSFTEARFPQRGEGIAASMGTSLPTPSRTSKSRPRKFTDALHSQPSTKVRRGFANGVYWWKFGTQRLRRSPRTPRTRPANKQSVQSMTAGIRSGNVKAGVAGVAPGPSGRPVLCREDSVALPGPFQLSAGIGSLMADMVARTGWG